MTPPTIHGVVDVNVIGPGYTADPGDPRSGKPYLQITFGRGDQAVVVCVTATVADMIGGIGRGAIGRWEDLQKQHGRPQ